MRKLQPGLLLMLGTIGASVAIGPPTSGSSIGFKEWRQYDQSDSQAPPLLNEPAPGCDLRLSNPGLLQVIGLWSQTTQPYPGVTSQSPAPEGPDNGPRPVPAPPSIVLFLFGMGFVVKRLRTAIRGKSSDRNRHRTSILDDDPPFEVEPSIYPGSEESIDRLHAQAAPRRERDHGRVRQDRLAGGGQPGREPDPGRGSQPGRSMA